MIELSAPAYAALLAGLVNEVQESRSELTAVIREIATNHIVGRAFCLVDTNLIVRLRRALDIKPYERKEEAASYAAKVKQAIVDGPIEQPMDANELLTKVSPAKPSRLTGDRDV